MLTATVVHIQELSGEQRRRMLSLMQIYYRNVYPDQFEKDLRRKDRVVLLWNGQDLRGFSTLVFFEQQVAGCTVKVAFSGDTIIDAPDRNSLALPKAWCSVMAEEMHSDPDMAHYWLLTSKGYKTYRYLPVFFLDFFPRPGRSLSRTEEEILRKSLRHLNIQNVDERYWMIRSSNGSQQLRPGVADISEIRRRKPEIAYFEEVNPGHKLGDELICLARFAEDNMEPRLWKRMMDVK
jgi:hypothetical protein